MTRDSYQEEPQRDLGAERREAVRLLRRIVRAMDEGTVSEQETVVHYAKEWLADRDAVLDSEEA